MSVYLELFLVFLEIGAISFGGGYGMIAPLKDAVLSHGWLDESRFIDFIAVSESTPGPLAVNMATFVGASQGGFLGALAATCGVILPAFAIILVIVCVINNLMKFAGVNAFVKGIRPCVTGLILGTAATMILSALVGISAIGEPLTFDARAAVLFALIAAVALVYKKIRKKSLSPILLIVLSAAYGMIAYSL